jgi:hypothetical protein
VTIHDRLFGRVCCWLGYHAWERPPDPAELAVATLLGYTERCHRCGAERDINRDL